MCDNTANDCIINGFQYKCRTCFNPGNVVFSLTDKGAGTKTWRNLLDDLGQLKAKNEELLPKTICCICVDKLLAYYNFQLQIQNVNNKYSQLLTNIDNTALEIVPKEIGNSTEVLAGPATPSSLEPYVTDIKLENECFAPYDIAVENNQEERNDFKSEDTQGKFKETDHKEPSFEDQQRSFNEESNDAFKGDLSENSSSISDDSDYLPSDGEQGDESNKHSERSPKIACNHRGKTFNCTSLSQQDIQNFNNIFYAKNSKSQQDAFIVKYCSISSIQRRRPRKRDTGSKEFETKCYVHKADNKCLVPVCQKTFLSILCLRRRRLYYVTKVFYEQGALPIEKRGGDHRSHKFEMKKAAVENFLSSFKCVETHYCRAPERRLYLSNVSSVSELHVMYDEKSPNELKVRLHYFRSIFNSKYNLGFRLPRMDECSICIELAEQIKRCRDENLKETYMEQKRIHTQKYKEFYAFLEDENPEIFILSFACQKNQMLPKVNHQDAHFRRQLHLQSVTLVQGPSTPKLCRNNVFIYTWTEDQYSKNVNLIASTVYHRLQCIHFENDITTLRLMADGCSGQNKKFTMIAMLSKWLSQAPANIKKVELIFPIIGHSSLPADIVSRKSEKQIKKIKTILHPEEYEEILSESGTVLRVADSCSVNDWKAAGEEFLLPPEYWHIPLSTIKKFYLTKHSNGTIMVTGEENYRIHFNETNYRTVCRENFNLLNMQPALIQPYAVRISSQQIRDINNTLKMHFGEDWRNCQKLKYYVDFINNCKPVEYDDDDDDQEEFSIRQDEYCSEPIEEAPLLNI